MFCIFCTCSRWSLISLPHFLLCILLFSPFSALVNVVVYVLPAHQVKFVFNPDLRLLPSTTTAILYHFYIEQLFNKKQLFTKQ